MQDAIPNRTQNTTQTKQVRIAINIVNWDLVCYKTPPMAYPSTMPLFMLVLRERYCDALD